MARAAAVLLAVSMIISSLHLLLLFSQDRGLTLAAAALIMEGAESADSPSSPLQVGFYNETCPMAEELVRDVLRSRQGFIPTITRMIFHDCFVRGCDASILLDSTANQLAEKDSRLNKPTLGGFNFYDKAKAAVEAHCPDTVSCADIIAFAARDAVYFSGGIFYEVPAGRRDGMISRDHEADENLPLVSFNAQQLQERFAGKKMGVEDLVALSGVHKIGHAHCATFKDRLYPQVDPSMDADLASTLKRFCPEDNPSRDYSVPQDWDSPLLLDNKLYQNIQKHKAVLASDQALLESNLTASLVARFAEDVEAWKEALAAAMVRMGFINVLTGDEGEIRKDCRIVNKITSVYTI